MQNWAISITRSSYSLIPFLATRLCLLLLSPMTSYKPYFHSFNKRAPITQPLVSMSELASPLPPHREQFTSQVLITRSDTQKLKLANLGLHLQLFSSVQLLSHVWLFATPWTAAHQASLSITNSPEFTQTHVHWVGDAIQPSDPLLSPSPPALNLSQNQGPLKWVSSSHQVAKILELQFQHQSFQWTLRTDFL